MVDEGKEYLGFALAGISKWQRHSKYGRIRFNVHTYTDDGTLLAKSGSIKVFRPVTLDDPLEIRVSLYSRPNLLPEEEKHLRVVIPVDGEPVVEGDWGVPKSVLEYVYINDPITQVWNVFRDIVNLGSSWFIDYWEVPVNGYTIEGFMPIFAGALEDDVVKLLAFGAEAGRVSWEGKVTDDISRIRFETDWGTLHFSVDDDLTIGGRPVSFIALAVKCYLNRPGSELSKVKSKIKTSKFTSFLT
ncbi:hypothetical protein [Thermococcus prieurii]